MSILVVGNVFKDVLLNFDESQGRFETDENGTPWTDLAFDGKSSLNFFSRSAYLSGSAVASEILKNFGIEILPVKNTEISHRYSLILDRKVSYIEPVEASLTEFITPSITPDWILIDNSAKLDRVLVEKILDYLNLNKTVRLAMYSSFDDQPLEISEQSFRTLLDKASVIFSNGEIAGSKQTVLTIREDKLQCGETEVYYYNRDTILPKRTKKQIVATTFLSGLIKYQDIGKALMLAKFNIENSNIEKTLSLNQLQEKIMEQEQKKANLKLIAKQLVAYPRGILAADESGGSIHKKFEAAGIPDDCEHRRDYRNIFFTTPGLADYVNGVILFDETARQLSDDGRTFVDYLTSMGIIPGIKVDQGLVNFSDGEHDAEKYTTGLEDLPSRLSEYYEMGARFAKWRAAFEVMPPSVFAMRENAKILARYARDCQEAGIVPIVEPEIVHKGNYSIKDCARATGQIFGICFFEELSALNVELPGCILKVNMVLAGSEFEPQSTPEEVGKATAEVLREHVPAELAGVVFPSGGQSVEEATLNLQAVTNEGPFPWSVTFSYARALQGPALEAWQGDNKNADAARSAFRERLVANCEALKKK